MVVRTGKYNTLSGDIPAGFSFVKAAEPAATLSEASNPLPNTLMQEGLGTALHPHPLQLASNGFGWSKKQVTARS